jgi:hypothetical protein
LLPALVWALVSASALAQAGPPAPARPAAPSPEVLAEGKAVFAKVVEGIGGASKARTVRDVQTRGEITATTPQGDMTMEIQTAMVFPDRLSQQVDAPFGRLAMVATPTAAFVVGPDGSQDLPESFRDELLRQVQRVPLLLAGKSGDPKLIVAGAGTAKIGEAEAAVVDIRHGDMEVRWFVDPKTGRILRSMHTATGPDGKQAQVVSDYSDYRLIDGFPVAHKLEVSTNGAKDQTLILEFCKINAGVDPKLFVKPPPPPATPTPAVPGPGL